MGYGNGNVGTGMHIVSIRRPKKKPKKTKGRGKRKSGRFKGVRFVRFISKANEQNQSAEKACEDMNMLESKRTFEFNPFEGIESKLPVNVKFVAEQSEKKAAITRNPEAHYQEAFVGRALEYYKQLNDKRYRVATLAQNATKIFNYNLVEIFFNGMRYSVSGWQDALALVLGVFAKERKDDIEFLEVAGQLKWIRANKPGTGMLEALRTGDCTANFQNILSVCRRLQWMFLMCGIPLNAVAVRYNAYTDAEWQRLLVREAEERAKEEERRRLQLARVTEKKVKEEERHNLQVQRQAQDKRLVQLVKCADSNEAARRELIEYGFSRCSKCGSWVKDKNLARHSRRCLRLGVSMPKGKKGTVRNITSHRTNVDYSTPVPEGTYIVVDGVVVFVNARHGNKSNDARITRSSSDSEDTWKGFGYIARDNGRFGGVIGEDYAD